MHHLAERNTIILLRVLAGETCRQVAEDYGLTGERILRIVHATFRAHYPQYRYRFDLGLAVMRMLVADVPTQEEATI